MTVDCKLCGESLAGADESRCRCGWRLDDGCQRDHAGWCPTDGEESWLGAQEI